MRRRDGVWAVVPIKELTLAKQRLAKAVPPRHRAGLAAAMASDVLETLSAVQGLAGIVVVTVDAQATAIAREFGAVVADDSARDGHTAVVAAAASRLAREGCRAMLTLPGDIPTLAAAEVEHLLQGVANGPSVTLVPSRDGDGTNAALCSPPTALAFAFGPGSFERHVGLVRRQGLEPRIVRSSGIGLDIDTPEDLRLLASHAADTRSRRYCREHLADVVSLVPGSAQ
mgnify:CR=1 FL=1